MLKLRGAGQGTSALVAELVVAELAELLGLPVPERLLVDLLPDYATDDRRDELADLLESSVGLNVGFRLLDGAVDLHRGECCNVSDFFAAATLWLDGLVMNTDRTEANPNILSWHQSYWLIDHGAALPFHHWWQLVTEDSPREPFSLNAHFFHSRRTAMAEFDDHFAKLVDRKSIERALNQVPDELLVGAGMEATPQRTRAAYAAFLWKRRSCPRPFL